MSALIWLLVCPGLHAAKPTRTLTRPPARLVATPSSHRSARDWSMHSPAAARPLARSAAHSSPHRLIAPTIRTSARKASSRDFLQAARPAAVASDRRDHAWQRAQRDAAARDAILAATRAIPSPAATRLPGDGTATGDEESAAIASAPVLPPVQSIDETSSVLLPPLRIASLYDGRGRLVVPPPLYGSREILLHQNLMADREGLDRVQDDAGLLDLLRERKLVALPTGETLRVDERLPENRRYSRPWTSAFLVSFSRDFYSIFHSPLQVNSAVRTVAFQQRLLRTNGNAASAAGEEASPHLTGQAVDIAKHGLSLAQIAWVRAYLSPLVDQGKIDVEEEFQQACFHISVYKNYPPAVPRVTATAARQLSTATLTVRPSY